MEGVNFSLLTMTATSACVFPVAKCLFNCLRIREKGSDVGGKASNLALFVPLLMNWIRIKKIKLSYVDYQRSRCMVRLD